MTGPAVGSSAPTPRISAVINTLNEEANLPYALRSVRTWVDEIVVVDMHSEDRTVEIAREYGSRVYLHPRIKDFDGARAFAVAQATGDWILMLDSDEVIPKALSETLIGMAQDDLADVVRVPMIHYMLGARMMYTHCRPEENYHPRFFKPGFLRLTERVHNFASPTPGARVRRVPCGPDQAIVHFANIDLSDILDKINRYTTLEAEQSPSRGQRPGALRAVARASKRFFHYYVTEKGYRDGWRGFYVSAAIGFYAFSIYIKLFELYRNGPREEVRRLYQTKAEKLILEYNVDHAARNRE